ncbi:hypothetical protein G6F31_018336 [Rhizopus arrhizus]|nr:hypothetical protein G6F31_018336 [Rhizopus arrhizus]
MVSTPISADAPKGHRRDRIWVSTGTSPTLHYWKQAPIGACILNSSDFHQAACVPYRPQSSMMRAHTGSVSDHLHA